MGFLGIPEGKEVVERPFHRLDTTLLPRGAGAKGLRRDARPILQKVQIQDSQVHEEEFEVRRLIDVSRYCRRGSEGKGPRAGGQRPGGGNYEAPSWLGWRLLP